MQPRLQELSNRHKQLEQDIIDEEKRPSPDTLRLRKLKSLKLRLKDEMDALKSA